MTARLQEMGIDHLSRRERIALAQEILDSVLAEESEFALTDAKRDELRRRLEECKTSPDDVVPWEQVKADSVARWGK